MSAVPVVIFTIVGVFSLFILMKKKKVVTDFVLLFINLAVALVVLSDVLVQNSISALTLFFHFNASFWLVSIFLVYAYSLIEGKGKLVIRWWYFGFSIGFLIFTIFDLFMDASKTEADFRSIFYDPNLVYHFFFKTNQIFVVVVCLDLLRKINKYNTNLKLSYSFIDHISLKWLRNYTFFILCLYATMFLSFLFYNFGLISDISNVYYILNALSVVGVFYLSFYGIQQYHLPLQSKAPKQEQSEKTTVLKSEETHQLYEALVDLFDKKQIYQNADLRINDVAEALNTSKHKLSQAINAEFGKPFYDFVAMHRVNALKAALVKTENLSFTILAVAYDVGFNSKASLNRLFKAHTGMTPSQYQKTHIVK